MKIGADIVRVADQSEAIEQAISHFNNLDCSDGGALLRLESALTTVLSLSPRKVNKPHESEPLNANENERLLSAIYRALADTILSLRGRVPLASLSAGLLAAAKIVESLPSGDFKNDRLRDAASQVKILVHYARILQHEDDIENRRRGRAGMTVAKLLPAADEVFG